MLALTRPASLSGPRGAGTALAMRFLGSELSNAAPAIYVQTRAHYDTGGPECLVQLACTLHSHGHRVYIYPTRIAPRFRTEYPCIKAIPQRSVTEADPELDYVIGPANHPCPQHVAHAYIWQLDTRSAARYRGNCSAIAHNHFLAHKYQAPLIRLYITPSTVRFCDAVMAKETQQTREARDLILVDDDTPPPVVARLTAAYPTSVRLVKGYSPAQVRELFQRARYVVDWSFVGSERMPLEAVLCGATLVTSNTSSNCALGKDFALPASSYVHNADELVAAVGHRHPQPAAMAGLRASFGASLNAEAMHEDFLAAIPYPNSRQQVGPSVEHKHKHRSVCRPWTTPQAHTP